MPSLLHVFLRSSAVLFIPFVEYLFLRLLIRDIWSLRIGWGAVLVDYDLLIPVPTAVFLSLYLLSQGRPLVLSLQKGVLFLHSIFFCAFVLLSFFYPFLLFHFGIWFQGVWWLSVLVTLGSAVFIFLNPRFFWDNPKRGAILSLPLVGLVLVCHKHFFDSYWQTLAPVITNTSCTLLNGIFTAGVHCSMSENHMMNILVLKPRFSLMIGKPCGGLDGILLFLACVAVGMVSNPRSLSLKQWGALICMGIPTLFLVNFLRIVLLFVIGAGLLQILDSLSAMRLLRGLFHVHIGWLLYLGTISFLFHLAYKKNESGVWKLPRLRKAATACVLFLVISAKVAFGVGCDAGCDVAADCTTGSCPVCVGSCIACADLGDQASCEDTGTGASTSCVWSGGACAASAVPEIPEGLRFLIFALISCLAFPLLRRETVQNMLGGRGP